MVSKAVLNRTFRSRIHTQHVSWNCAHQFRIALSDCACFPNLVRIYSWTTVPRQSFWINMGIYAYMYIYRHTHTHIVNQEINRLNFLFLQDGCNVLIKGFHILNAPPFCDTVISLFKRVFTPKLEATVSVLNELYFLLVLSFAISISISSIHESASSNTSSSYSSSSTSSSAGSVQIQLY